MNSIVSACFVGFDVVRIVTSENVAADCAVVICSDSGAETVVSCSEKACDMTLCVDEIDVRAAYTAAIVDTATGERSEAVAVRKDTLYDTDEFNKRYNYDGRLGVKYAAAKSEFAVWAPFASCVTLRIYNSGLLSDTLCTAHKMKRSNKGVWSATVKGDLNGKYYTFSVEADGCTREVVDPYAVSAGRNGVRGAVLDLSSTAPDGWADHSIPNAVPFSNHVIYEAHLRDLTISPSSGVSGAHRGKYLGLTERGDDGNLTPLDYIQKLGVTAVHFQPLFDFASVDESFKIATRNREGEYNWGYDPLNYNVPEGSYSTDSDNAAARVKELKQMIMALHNAGIRVIMDVVYNHMYDASTSSFQALVPNYYFRTDENGGFLNGSGCGNETASERYMFRKFMIDSVSHWAREYKVDGFRFDLMALHDVDTMNAVCAALKKINPAAVVYGEGWDAGTNGLPFEKRACKANAHKVPDIAFFDDIVRDGLRGSVFEIGDNGFVSGKQNAEAAVLVAAAGATDIVSDEKYKTLGDDKAAFALSPSQNINYVAVHDNTTLWDKLNASVNADDTTLKAMNRLAATAIMTGQGASLILAGEEMLRSKPTQPYNDYNNGPSKYITKDEYWFADNSYRSPDSVNEIDFKLADKNADTVSFYAGLIKIKTTFQQFHIADSETLKTCLHFGTCGDGLTVFCVRDPDSDEFAFVAVNASRENRKVDLPIGSYRIYVNGDRATGNKAEPLASLTGKEIMLMPLSSVVMTATLDRAAVKDWAENTNVGASRNIDRATIAKVGVG
ncbi:MAG: type I pullulanase, partial [Clostridiales bacterium]|nr:type I pullulanase [Clostridiales bacterium]